MKKMAEAKKGVQHPKGRKEARSARRNPQALKRVKKTLANLSRLKVSANFNSSHQLTFKAWTQAHCTSKESCQNISKDQQDASSFLSPNPNIEAIMSSSINPDIIFQTNKGNWEESEGLSNSLK